jgi:hypothetical protein
MPFFPTLLFMIQTLAHNFWTANNDSKRQVTVLTLVTYNNIANKNKIVQCELNKYITYAYHVKLVMFFALLCDRSLFTCIFISYHYCQHVTDH